MTMQNDVKTQTPPPNPPSPWFYKAGEAKSGPITDHALRELLAKGTLPLDTKVWRFGMESWLPARDAQELFPNGVPLYASIAGANHADLAFRSAAPVGIYRWLQERPAVPTALTVLAVACTAQLLWGFVSWMQSRDEIANGRLTVSGFVTLNGAPLDGGTISFRGTSGEPFGARASVDSGQFHIPQHKGLATGTYRVRINKHIPAIPDETSRTRVIKPGTELIPPRYNETTALTADIPQAGVQTLRFDLKTK